MWNYKEKMGEGESQQYDEVDKTDKMLDRMLDSEMLAESTLN